MLVRGLCQYKSFKSESTTLVQTEKYIDNHTVNCNEILHIYGLLWSPTFPPAAPEVNVFQLNVSRYIGICHDIVMMNCNFRVPLRIISNQKNKLDLNSIISFLCVAPIIN